MDRGLGDRIFTFVIEVIKFLQKIVTASEVSVLKHQLTKASSSSGANYEEAQAASSKADFRNKISIALREMREANYWLRILKALEVGNIEKGTYLIKESEELKRILGSIASKVK